MMIKTTHLYKARSEINAFEILNDGSFFLSTRLHGAKAFSIQTDVTLANISIKLLGYKTTAVAFSSERMLLAFANETLISIYDIQTKRIIHSIRTFEGTISQLHFISSTRYIVTGTSRGRVMQYRYDGRLHLSRLCSFFPPKKSSISKASKSSVSAFAFHKNTLAVSGYGGLINILSPNTYMQRETINASQSAINALCFLEDGRLVSGSFDGKIKVHSLKKHTRAITVDMPFSEIHSIVQMQNPNFIVVGGASENLALIDLTKRKVVAPEFLIYPSNVTNILLSPKGTLIISTQTQEVYKTELSTSGDIKSYILHSNLDKAYAAIEANPMLQGIREHKRVEVLYEKYCSQAIVALIESNHKEAKRIMQMFSKIQSKKNSTSALFSAFEHFARFKGLYLEKRYPLAYAIAEKYPPLQSTQQYKNMEATFKESFTFAQKQMILGREDIAKETLAPYGAVLSKRPLLKLILQHNDNFINFLKAVNAKEYLKIEELLQQDDSFQNIPSYLALVAKYESQFAQVQSYIEKGNITQANELLEKLKDIPSKIELIKELRVSINQLSDLKQSYESDDFVRCYEILDESPSIAKVELCELLEKHWIALMHKCEDYALKGDFKSLKKTLGSLMFVKTRSEKIGDLLRLSFHIRIKGLFAKEKFAVAESLIYKYIDIFTQDREILLLMKTYQKLSNKKLAITQEINRIHDRNNWRNSPHILDV